MTARTGRRGSTEIAYPEASARRLATHRAGKALEDLARLPSIERSAVEGAGEVFERREWEVDSELERELHRRQAETLSRVVATDALRELAEVDLLPKVTVQQAAQAVAADVGRRQGGQ